MIKRKSKASKKTTRKSKLPVAARNADTLPVRPVSEMTKHRDYVFYGRSGTGKTTLAGTFPGPILLLDVRDRGTDSLLDVEDIDVFEVGSFDDYELAYYHLLKNPKGYKTVVIDTLSQLQQMVVEEISQGKKKKSNKAAGAWGTLTKGDWGDVAGQMKTWITNYRNLELNVVFIAQDRVSNAGDDEDDGALEPEIGPQLSPSVAKHLNASVSTIGNTFIRTRHIIKEVKRKGKKPIKKELTKIEYCLRIGPNPIYVTKTRKPRSVEPPSVLIDPSYEDFIELLKGE